MYQVEIRSRRLDWHNPFTDSDFHSFQTEWEALGFIQDNMLLKKWEPFEIRITHVP